MSTYITDLSLRLQEGKHLNGCFLNGVRCDVMCLTKSLILLTQDHNNLSLWWTACHRLTITCVFSLWSEGRRISCFVLVRKFSSFQVDYTGVDMSSPCYNCSQSFSWNNTRPCTCSIPFYLDQPYEVTAAPYVPVFSSLHSLFPQLVSSALINRAVSSCITASPTSTKTTVATSSQETTAS